MTSSRKVFFRTVAHEVNNSPACAAAIARAFPGVRQPDGTVDRRQLAAVVFADPDALRQLVGITFPLILAECESRMEGFARAGARACVLDAPTLFESGGDRLCDVIVSVVTQTMPRGGDPRLRPLLLLVPRYFYSRPRGGAIPWPM